MKNRSNRRSFSRPIDVLVRMRTWKETRSRTTWKVSRENDPSGPRSESWIVRKQVLVVSIAMNRSGAKESKHAWNSRCRTRCLVGTTSTTKPDRRFACWTRLGDRLRRRIFLVVGKRRISRGTILFSRAFPFFSFVLVRCLVEERLVPKLPLDLSLSPSRKQGKGFLTRSPTDTDRTHRKGQ